MLVRVPTVQTPFFLAEYVEAIIKAWYKIYGSYPSKKSVAVLYSQLGVETALSKKCWNYNLGNIKAIDTPGQNIKYCALKGVWEMVNGKRVELDSENPGAWFRAFDTFNEGVDFYIGFLRNKRYKIAWAGVEAGDPVKFATLLRQQGYYTASVADYVKLMNYYFNGFMKDNLFESVVEKLSEQALDPTPIVHPDVPLDDVKFDVIEDVVEKPDAMTPEEPISNTTSFAMSIINKFKSFLRK